MTSLGFVSKRAIRLFPGAIRLFPARLPWLQHQTRRDVGGICLTGLARPSVGSILAQMTSLGFVSKRAIPPLSRSYPPLSGEIFHGFNTRPDLSWICLQELSASFPQDFHGFLPPLQQFLDDLSSHSTSTGLAHLSSHSTSTGLAHHQSAPSFDPPLLSREISMASYRLLWLEGPLLSPVFLPPFVAGGPIALAGVVTKL